jgi:hypothetical protein
MSETASQPALRRVLRVAIAAADPVRQTGLTAIVWNAGHVISENLDTADVVLADGVAPGSGPHAVTLDGNVPLSRACYHATPRPTRSTRRSAPLPPGSSCARR